MAWDTEGTKRKIVDAATREFVRSGPDGTTIERIAKSAGVNKERVYAYYGGKGQLFAQVLRDQLATAAQDVSADMTSSDGIAEYAGKLFDYNREHPALARLLKWEALAFEAAVPEEQSRRDYYATRTAAFAEAQAAGVVVDSIEPDVLHFMLLSLAGYWAVLPQIARMITGPGTDSEEDARRRASVVEAARRLVAPSAKTRVRS
jgi:AcrR family transcriptional regulator